MKKKDRKNQSPEDSVMPKSQLIRLRKLFSSHSGRESTQVNQSRLN